MNENTIIDQTMWELAAGADRALVGSQGGAVLGWVHDGQAMLCPAPVHDGASFDPLATASFPLVPYSNRIGQARFCWDEQEQRLRANFPPEPHAIHGTGWKRRWTLAERSEDRVVLDLTQEADGDWPWPFMARQTIALEGGTLSLTLTARNLAERLVPLAFGHHPYFDAAGAALQFQAARVWSREADLLPGSAAPPVGPFDFAASAPVADREIDHCYEGWDGRAAIRWAGRRYGLDLSASAALPCAVVYIPAAGERFCFEPVPHAIDALNRSDAAPMPAIAPGDSFTATILMEAVQA